MKHLLLIATFCLLALTSRAQTITYATDTTCGCDIFFVDGIQTTKENNLYGFRRADGTVISPNIFRYVDKFSNGYCKVWVDDPDYPVEPGQEPPLLAGLIDSTGRQVIPCLYDAVELPSSHRIAVSKNNLTGYADLNGNIAIPIQYFNASSFVDNYAAVGVIIDSFFVLYTFIDTLGRQIFPPVFQNAHPFTDGFAPVRRYDRWGIIDTLGNEVIAIRYENITIPDHHTLFAGDSLGMHFFRLPDNLSPITHHSSLQPLTPPYYFPVAHLSEGRIPVFRDGKQGFLDTLGNEVIPCIYDEVSIFRNARAAVRNNDLWGIIDTLGDTILPLHYHDQTPKGMKYVYYDSLALVELDGRLGFVDLQGNLAIPFYFDQAFQFSEGLAAVRHNGHWGYIDTHGDIFLPFIFDIASPFQYGRADIYFQGRYHAIDRNGRCVKNCDEIISFR